MRFILHIGIHKTGTSAIQEFFSRYRDLLMKKYCILYPETGIIGHAHYYLPYSFLPWVRKRFFGNVDVKKFSLKLRKLLFEELRLNNPNYIVISSEDFISLDKDLILKFKEYYNFPITDVICYIRRQDLAVESIYRQIVKDPISSHKGTFKGYILKDDWKINRLDYYTLLSNWKEAFPEARIIPRIYDRKLFPEGNVILDFLSVLGIDIPEARTAKIEANPSLSHLSTLVMRRINEEFDLSNEDHWKVVNFLLKLDKEEGSIIKSFFTLQERIEFLNRFKEANEKLFREYFGCENKFVLSEEEIEFYKEQDKIPREVIEKALEERYRKALEFMRSSGILMKEKLFPKVRVNYLPNNNLELFRIDILQVNLLNGRLIIGGLALPKKDVEEMPKLTIRDAEGVKEVQWKLPSPVLGEQYPDNPKAKNARFRVDGVVAGDRPIEVYLDGEKIAEILIEGRSSKKTGRSSGENNSAGGQRANDVQKGKRVSWLRKLLRF